VDNAGHRRVVRADSRDEVAVVWLIGGETELGGAFAGAAEVSR